MKRTAIGVLLAAGLAGSTLASQSEESSVSAAATYLYLATLCDEGAAPQHAANARQLGDILHRLDESGTETMKTEMALLNEIAEIENEDGSVDPARKAAFCAENQAVLTALGPEVEMWIYDLSPEGEPAR